MYPDKTYTRKISISILKYSTLYTWPPLHCSNYSVNTPHPELLIEMVSLVMLSLVMHGFCSNKVLYSANLSSTMFIGPVAVVQWVLHKRVCPSFPLSGCFLGIGSLVFLNFSMVLSGAWQSQTFLEKFLFPQKLGKWVKIGPKIEIFWI